MAMKPLKTAHDMFYFVEDVMQILGYSKWYVRHRGLPVDEYLDVAVFGYLLAVKRWFARPDLYRYEFTTIACAAMRSAIGNEQRKQSRRIKTVSLDDPIPGTDGMTWEDIITEDHLVYSA